MSATRARLSPSVRPGRDMLRRSTTTEPWAVPPQPQFEVRVRSYLTRMQQTLAGVDEAQLAGCLGILWRAWEQDRTAFIVGNGGSASTASHMACDLSKQSQLPGRKPLRAHSLTDNVELISAFGNDLDYSRIFAEQLRIHARPGDLLICISCSGNSPNVVHAIGEARSLGLNVLAFGGSDGGAMAKLSDLYVHVPSDDYGLIESAHVVFDHCLTNLLYEQGRMTVRQRPVVLVDRDGVIVRNRPDYVKSWDEVELLPGAVEALATLSQHGYRVLVVTNQSAVGRGIMTPEDLERIHHRLAGTVAVKGGNVEAFLVCPHGPDEACICRKPSPGLLLQAREGFGVDLESSYFVGDSESDVEAAAAAGCGSILVLSGRTAVAQDSRADHVVADLRVAVDVILGRNQANGDSGHEEPSTPDTVAHVPADHPPEPVASPYDWAPVKPAYDLAKRVLDVCFATLALGLLSPLWLLIAVAVVLTSPGPVLFRGTVVGRAGRPFTYHKFRTMRSGDDRHHREWLERYVTSDAPYGGSVYKVIDDPRRTRVGKLLRRLSLDEIPQFIDVLRGHMSVVGPRPPLLYEFDLYSEQVRRRLAVKPGITGLYQVTARGAAPFSQMVALDLHYIRRRSLWLDLTIMVRTVGAMISGKGAG